MTVMDRRSFIRAGAAAGGGLLLTIYWPTVGDAAPGPSFAPNAFLRIASDETVTVTIPKQEMGQGVRTALAMVVAEELDAEWEKVQVEQADLDEARYGEQYTGGSSSVRLTWTPLRTAGATAHAMLVGAAAAKWGVDVGSCHAS